MKTIELTQAEMAGRVARFRDLKPLPTQAEDAVPLAAKDVVYARKLLSVIGLEDSSRTPISSGAPIKGAAGMTMTLAVCPPGQGPELHAHLNTYETFTVLRGRFEFRWNDDGSERVVLDELDTISLPPGVCRAFRNVGDAEGIVQVLITGGVHDMTDIDFARHIGDKLERIDARARTYFEQAGFTFTAGREG
jgi:quercetin dioxygenase-like cupin family protein